MTTKDGNVIPGVNTSMNDDNLSLEEKISILSDRAKDIQSFLETLVSLKSKLEKKKQTIKEIIQKKIEDNAKELQKWKELLFTVVDESLDEKITKLDSQTKYFIATKKEIDAVLESNRNQKDSETASVDSDEESEDPKLDDLLELELNLQPEGLSQNETTEMDSRVKNDFNILLNEPKKSLRRTFAYVGGIIRGYLRRGKSNIDWIKIMRKLEGREFEDRVLSEADPYVGAKVNFEEPLTMVKENVSNTWNSMMKLFENRNHPESRDAFCNELYKYYDRHPEDVEFYLPQLCNLLLNQFYQFQPLKRFVLDKCSQSIHFALQLFLLVRASKDSREPPKKKKIIPPSIVKWRILCDQLMNEIMKSVRLPITGTIPVSNSQSQQEVTVEEMFKFPIHFMDRLVEISNHLPSVPSDQYAIELAKRLEKENKFLQEESSRSGAFVYIPLLKPVGSAEYHRLVRIPSSEANPIPTYGRVLYYVIAEVVDAAPESVLSEEREEKKKHKKEKKQKKEKKEKREVLIDSALDETGEPSANTQFEMEPDANAVQTVPHAEILATSPKKSIPIEPFTEPIERSKSPEPTEEAVRAHEEPTEGDISLRSSSASLHEDERDRHHKKKKEKHKEEEGGEHKKHHKKKKDKSDSGGSEHSSPKESSPINQLSNANGVFNFHEPALGNHSGFGEMWERKVKRIKAESPYGNNLRWRMMPLIVKAGEEVLQEEFAMQLIVQFQRIFHETGVPVKLVPYRILAISAKSGLIEPVPNSLSLDKLKKQHTNLLNFFIQAFGETSGPTFKQAQMNFVKTMAAYSIVCYLLQIKDRHNGNILVDACGHVIHIDFGYLLSKSIAFEKAPFKLTTEFVDVMGGYKSPCYKEYCKLCVRAFLGVRKHYKKIMLLVEMTMEGKGKKVLPCLQEGQKVLTDILLRFHLDWSDDQCEKFIMELIEEARGSWRTAVYDAYQLILNNIH